MINEGLCESLNSRNLTGFVGAAFVLRRERVDLSGQGRLRIVRTQQEGCKDQGSVRKAPSTAKQTYKPLDETRPYTRSDPHRTPQTTPDWAPALLLALGSCCPKGTDLTRQDRGILQRICAELDRIRIDQGEDAATKAHAEIIQAFTDDSPSTAH